MARDLYLGACYFSPQGATIWARMGIDPFDVLEADLLDVTGKGDVILCGDFNARTGVATRAVQMAGDEAQAATA